jgi:hypothetical protein
MFEKYLKYQISRKSVQWEPSCSLRTNRHDESLFAILRKATKRRLKTKEFLIFSYTNERILTYNHWFHLHMNSNVSRVTDRATHSYLISLASSPVYHNESSGKWQIWRPEFDFQKIQNRTVNSLRHSTWPLHAQLHVNCPRLAYRSSPLKTSAIQSPVLTILTIFLSLSGETRQWYGARPLRTVSSHSMRYNECRWERISK